MKKRITATLTILILFSVLLFSQTHSDHTATEVWDPEPEVIEPGNACMPPSDAIVLFDGSDLSEWVGRNGEDAKWDITGDFMTIGNRAGSIKTRRSFGDCQLHIEWKTPAEIKGEGQGRGNSGIFLMGKYEVQLLDSYNNRTYSNGQAGAVYKQYIPEVNACRPPGEWQSFDIVFTAPKFSENGELLKPAYLTVFHNGVMIHNHVEIKGTTTHQGLPEYEPHEEKLPVSIQDHLNPVSFRNIWIREL